MMHSVAVQCCLTLSRLLELDYLVMIVLDAVAVMIQHCDVALMQQPDLEDDLMSVDARSQLLPLVDAVLLHGVDEVSV